VTTQHFTESSRHLTACHCHSTARSKSSGFSIELFAQGSMLPEPRSGNSPGRSHGRVLLDALPPEGPKNSSHRRRQGVAPAEATQQILRPGPLEKHNAGSHISYFERHGPLTITHAKEADTGAPRRSPERGRAFPNSIFRKRQTQVRVETFIREGSSFPKQRVQKARYMSSFDCHDCGHDHHVSVIHVIILDCRWITRLH
jgi:hypothetical protein